MGIQRIARGTMSTGVRQMACRSLEMLLAFILGLAGVAKAGLMVPFSEEIEAALHVSAAVATWTAVGVCALEFHLAFGLLFSAREGRKGILHAAVAMLIAYSALMILKGDAHACMCFGLGRPNTLAAVLDGQPLARNGILLLICSLCMILRRRDSRSAD